MKVILLNTTNLLLRVTGRGRINDTSGHSDQLSLAIIPLWIIQWVPAKVTRHALSL